MKYNVFRQLAVCHPDLYQVEYPFLSSGALHNWVLPRALELVYTAHDLLPLAQDCGYVGSPFPWDEMRRFEIRCELDAAFFHLYLPATPIGEWQPAENEIPQHLSALRAAFPCPRDAVAYILDQFPIVRDKDQKAHGHYRTKDRILALYDAMLVAQRTSQAFVSSLNPPPGTL